MLELYRSINAVAESFFSSLKTELRSTTEAA
jgi:hypothetical protein